MAKLQTLTIKKPITVDNYTIEVLKDAKNELEKKVSGEVWTKCVTQDGRRTNYTKVPDEHAKTVWQKAQQQQ